MRLTHAAVSRRLRALCALVAAGASQACDSGPTEHGAVRQILISSPPTQLRPGASLRVAADPIDAAGKVVEGVKVTWRTLTPATLDVSADGLIRALAPGAGVARASSGSVAALMRLDLVNPPIVAITLDADSIRLALPGGLRALRAVARDAAGVELIGAALEWESSATRIAAVTTAGTVKAVAVGSARITVRGEERVASTFVIVEAPPSATSPVIAGVSPVVAVPGQTMVVNGSGFGPTRSTNAVMIDGVAIPVSAASTTQLSLALPPGAAFPCETARTVSLQVGTSGGIGVAQLILHVANPLRLEVGESVVMTSAAEARCNELAPAAGRYVITVPNAARALGAGMISLELRGEATPTPFGLALDGSMVAQRNAASSSAYTRRTRADARPRSATRATPERPGAAVRDVRLQARVHARLLDVNQGLVAGARPPPPRRSEGTPAVVVPTPGRVLPVRIPSLGQVNFCDNFTAIGARTIFVGEHVVILEDTSAVLDGLGTLARQMDGAYAAIGAELDGAGWTVVQAFGNPLVMDSRLDDNGRVMIVFTPRMNQQLGGSVLATVVNCDFFARAQFAASNVGEYLYAQVPTSLAAGMGPGTLSQWRHEMRATLVHELKHVTSFAEHIVRGRPLEENWLEEATARGAEEIYGRDAFGVARSANAGFAAELACELHSGDPVYPACLDAPRAMRPHLEALWDFLSSPTAHSPFGPVAAGDFSYYGSGWALVRWLVDQEGLAEPAFFTALTTSGQTGVANLEGRTNRAWDEILPEWSLALVTDDRAGLVTASSRVQFPAWDLRSIYQGFCDIVGSCIEPMVPASPFTRAYPLQSLQVEAGSFGVEFAEIAPGGFAAVELAVTAATARQLIELRGIRGAALPSGVRLGIMRVP